MKLGVSNTIPNIVNLPGQGDEPAYGPEAFVTKWRVSSGDTIQLMEAVFVGSPLPDYDVDWGDGNEEFNVNTPDKTHTYTFSGGGTKDFRVVITRNFNSLDMSRATTAQQGYLIDMTQWGTDNAWTSVHNMFESCTNMTYSATDAPDLTSLTEKNTDRMFYECESITSLDLTGWNVIEVLQMVEMFYGMINCTEINLNNWATQNVVDASKFCSMVGNSINRCDFIVSNLWWRDCTTINEGFGGSYIASIDVSGWNFGTSLTLDHLFEGQAGFWINPGSFDIDLSTWVGTSNMTSMSYFINQSDVLSLEVAADFDTSNVTNMYRFAYGAFNLTHITGLDVFDSSSLFNVAMNTADGCMEFMRGAQKYDFGQPHADFGNNWGPNFGPGLLRLMGFFRDCGNAGACIDPPDVSNWNVSNIKGFNLMFKQAGWSSSNNPDVSNWDVSSATTFSEFGALSSISALDTSNWEISSTCTSMWQFLENSDFNGTIDFSHPNCDFSGVTTFWRAFYNVPLTTFTLHANSDFSSCQNFTEFNPYDASLSTPDYDFFLSRLAATGMAGAITLDVDDAQYTIATAGADHSYLTGTLGWTINDGGGI